MFIVDSWRVQKMIYQKQVLILPLCVFPAALLCVYTSVHTFIYRTVVLLHMLFHGSLCDLITYCERFPTGTCIFLQNPTRCSISCCWGCSACPWSDRQARGPRHVREGGVCTTQRKARGGVWISTCGWGQALVLRWFPWGPWRLFPTADCVVDTA